MNISNINLWHLTEKSTTISEKHLGIGEYFFTHVHGAFAISCAMHPILLYCAH